MIMYAAAIVDVLRIFLTYRSRLAGFCKWAGIHKYWQQVILVLLAGSEPCCVISILGVWPRLVLFMYIKDPFVDCM